MKILQQFSVFYSLIQEVLSVTLMVSGSRWSFLYNVDGSSYAADNKTDISLFNMTKA